MGVKNSKENIIQSNGEIASLNECYCKWCMKNVMGEFKGLYKCSSDTYIMFNKCDTCLKLIRNLVLL